jgi:hypothetical protein
MSVIDSAGIDSILGSIGAINNFLSRGRVMIRDHIRKPRLSRFIYLVCLTILSACAKPSVVELSLTSPYAQVVGARYRIIEVVNAYGIYQDLDKRKVISYIELIPSIRIAGPEVAFEKRINKGNIITVLSAWRKSTLLSSDVYYVIALQDADLPRDIQVRIELSTGNEGDGAELNPHVYEKITGK